MDQSEDNDSPGINFPPPFLMVVPMILGVLVSQVVPLPIPRRDILFPIGAGLFCGGVLVLLTALIRFAVARTNFIPNKPASTLVTGGPYRYTRNPMYFGLALLYIGISLSLTTAWPLLFFPVAIWAMQRFVIAPEERYLERRFGDEYLAYKTMVRRWI